MRQKSKGKPQPRKSLGGGLTAEGNTSKQMLNQIAPKLLIVIRDSMIQFEDEVGGAPLTEGQLLEQRLATIACKSNRRANLHIRDAIVNYFEDRDLLAMCAPFSEENGSSKDMN